MNLERKSSDETESVYLPLLWKAVTGYSVGSDAANVFLVDVDREELLGEV